MTDDETNQLVSLVNSHMQDTYSAVLGHSEWAYRIADRIGAGVASSIRRALRDMGSQT